ncbi:MAG: Pirin domain-containing protein [Deltaproteobacteria bacterium RBG_13_53_10]|nr:MAG: Pirin domain-containing protein [Deltaproteobacteria bacterium RBG_13_53_10]
MIQIIPANQRHFSDFGWLKTYWLFSFSNYYDPFNIQFGALRVFNDDVVEPRTGFPTHPHEEMEIVTIALSGEITHKDSMGNKNVIKAGDVQRMSAGTGLTHSEFNLAKEPVHFYQIWIYPDLAGLKPSYDQKSFSPDSWKNRLLPVASGQGLHGAVTFHTYATIYRSDLEARQKIDFKITEARRIFLYLTSGSLGVNDKRLEAKDQARIDLETELEIRSYTDSSFILIDVPSCKGWGYDEKTLRGSKT